MPAAPASPAPEPATPHNATNNPAPASRTPTHRSTFKRTLGEYPLRFGGAAMLSIRSRKSKPAWGLGTGCAFAVSTISENPRTRKQAMAEDRVGWGQAERAEIANHAANGSWTVIDRSQLPAGRSLVRL
eukprot:86533-Pleurochrysis_carterae.AAC.3